QSALPLPSPPFPTRRSSDLVELADNDVFVLEKLIERTDRQLRTLRDFLARERLETRFDQHLPGHRQQVIEFLLATLLRGSPARLDRKSVGQGRGVVGGCGRT